MVIPKRENIILNQRLIQRFYAYSVLDFYSKYFKINFDTKSSDYDEENNIYALKSNSENTNADENDKNKNKYAKNAMLKGKNIAGKKIIIILKL